MVWVLCWEARWKSAWLLVKEEGESERVPAVAVIGLGGLL